MPSGTCLYRTLNPLPVFDVKFVDAGTNCVKTLGSEAAATRKEEEWDSIVHTAMQRSQAEHNKSFKEIFHEL